MLRENRGLLLGLCLLLPGYQTWAQVPRAETVKSRRPPDSTQVLVSRRLPQRLAAFAARPAVRATLVPGLLLGAGVLTTQRVRLLDSDEELREEYSEHFGRPHTSIDDQLRHVPAYAALGLSVLGVKGRHGTFDQAVLFALTSTINNTITSNLKRLTHVVRPDGVSYSSFPSQHTSAAFSAATLLHKEYGGRSLWYSAGGYGVATLTGGLRLAKDNHWLSDVLAGAGVGIFSTELTYWVYPMVQRAARKIWRGRPATGRQTMVLPYYFNGAAGATLVLVR